MQLFFLLVFLLRIELVSICCGRASGIGRAFGTARSAEAAGRRIVRFTIKHTHTHTLTHTQSEPIMFKWTRRYGYWLHPTHMHTGHASHPHSHTRIDSYASTPNRSLHTSTYTYVNECYDISFRYGALLLLLNKQTNGRLLRVAPLAQTLTELRFYLSEETLKSFLEEYVNLIFIFYREKR